MAIEKGGGELSRVPLKNINYFSNAPPGLQPISSMAPLLEYRHWKRILPLGTAILVDSNL